MMIIASTSSLVTSSLFDGADELALEHHADAVGEVEHVVDVVADQEDPDPLRLQLRDEVAHLAGLGRSERRRGLVHDQDLGVEVDGPGDGHRLALPTRQRPAPASCRFLNRGLSRSMNFCVADDIAESSSEPILVSSSRPRNTLPAASMLSASASFW